MRTPVVVPAAATPGERSGASMHSIRATGLGKAYRLYDRPIDSLKELLFRRRYHREFWALRDVDLSLAQGSALGIIGDNGAGKSTLLKLLAGTIEPTVGTVERAGSVSSMLELGAGFDPELSGRMNVRIGCALRGLSPDDTERLVPEVIAFSELEQFIDRPVKTYSSGMALRIGFAVATMLDPQLLVVDEHLAVGDQHFRKKCMNRISAMMQNRVTLVLCSHDLHALREVCDQGLWLREGRPERFGPMADVLEAYQDHVRELDAARGAPARVPGPETGEAAASGTGGATDSGITAVMLGGDCRDDEIESGSTLVVRIAARLSRQALADGVHVGVLIVRNDLVWVYGVSTLLDDVAGATETALFPLGDDRYGIDFVVPSVPLLAGQYTMTVALLDGRTPHIYDSWRGVAPFRVRQRSREVGLVQLQHRWERPHGA